MTNWTGSSTSSHERQTLGFLRLEKARRKLARASGPTFRGANDDIQRANNPEIILTGPTRTGKTLAVLSKLYTAATNHDNFRGLIIRKVRSDLSETGLVTWERDCLGIDHPLVVDGPRRQWRFAYNFPNGSTVVVGGMDKPGKILSSEYDMIVVIQAEELDEPDWETLITRNAGRALPQEQQQVIGDCNPRSQFHWIFQRSLNGKMALWKTYHRDNPLLCADPDGPVWTDFGRQYLDKLQLLTGVQRKRLLLGEWVQPEGIVYDDFDEQNIEAREPDPEQPIEIAADDGFIDPRVFLFIQRTATEILVFDEIYHSRHLAETCVGEALERCGKNKWPKPDIAVGGPESKELAARFRLADIPYRSRPHKIVEGIQVVRRLIQDGNGYRALRVHPRCKNLIRELTEGYRYPETGTKSSDEVPIDENNHAADALRYWSNLRAR